MIKNLLMIIYGHYVMVFFYLVKECLMNILSIVFQFFISLVMSIVNLVLRIIQFILRPYSIPDVYDEVDFIYEKITENKKGIKNYLWTIHLCISIAIPCFLIIYILDMGFWREDLFIGLGIFYGYHGLWYLMCILLCRNKYETEFEKAVQVHDKEK